ncbi:WavE lipopolysaccharide synthesis family protein [Marinobacter piscensis]|uniref:WavE lipopolysaccharide synthesis family protein n=1 Tax=Marinobacter piscensis TaxID=1562308 RepID=UPI00119F7973|nr:WavE lipopolysaccharide synthesis family protein [Marinobacter piscensis]
MTNFKDISVVVQGPVQSLKGREQEEGITQKCLSSIRTFLPGAHIILSTWPDQQLAGLDYDELVISEDPGPNIRNFYSDGQPQYYNNNRQIVSTLAGLRQVSTPYAIKLRSDNYLTGNGFVELQSQYPKRCKSHRIFRERVVVSNVFTRRYAKGFKVAFHLSDFFYYGLTEDLLAIWDLELLDDVSPEQAAKANALAHGFIIDCTQMFWLRTLKKFDGSIKLDGLFDNSRQKLELSDGYYANNLVIASPEELGLSLKGRFSGNARIARQKGKCAQWQHWEWQELYRRFCDPEMPHTPLYKKLRLFGQRIIYVYPARLETAFKLWKQKYKQSSAAL